METGTRGSSAKEAAADVVLALLADREITGTISNTRMALRKLRGGKVGTETPFDLKVVNLGVETTCVVKWRQDKAPATAAAATKDKWPRSLKIFKDALLVALAKSGKATRPFGSAGPEVRAVALQYVRGEFLKAYPTAIETADAKRMAFGRALKNAREREPPLICSRELGGTDYLWLATEDEPDTTADPPRGGP